MTSQRTKRAPVPRQGRRAARGQQPTRGPKPGAAREEGPQRIAKLLARAGIASRRDIERMIAEGRIALHGEKLTTPATLLENLQGVTVDGQPVKPAGAARLFLFYKPAGCLTAARDPKGRPTIYDKLPKGLPRLMPVGRLDYMTEGLLLLTNDGELKRQLELPSTGVVRRYRARAFGDVTQAQLEALAEGVTIDGMRYGSIDANLERRTGRNCWIELSLTEGKNREVRNVLAHLGLQVSRLIRTSYGPFTVEGLEPGDVGEVQREDLFRFPPDAQMRIIAGEWRGRKLVAPAGQQTRPTADRTRETLFSMLASRLGSFEGLRVADLYAGSGALGLEALSRGAAHATLVENDRAALNAIEANVEGAWGRTIASRCGRCPPRGCLLRSRST